MQTYADLGDHIARFFTEDLFYSSFGFAELWVGVEDDGTRIRFMPQWP